MKREAVLFVAQFKSSRRLMRTGIEKGDSVYAATSKAALVEALRERGARLSEVEVRVFRIVGEL